jgi:hypothetical protein
VVSGHIKGITRNTVLSRVGTERDLSWDRTEKSRQRTLSYGNKSWELGQSWKNEGLDREKVGKRLTESICGVRIKLDCRSFGEPVERLGFYLSFCLPKCFLSTLHHSCSCLLLCVSCLLVHLTDCSSLVSSECSSLLSADSSSLLPADCSSLLSADSSSLLSADCSSLLSADCSYLISADSASLLSADSSSLLSADCLSLISADCSSLLSADCSSLISADCSSLLSADCSSLMSAVCSYLLSADYSSLLSADLPFWQPVCPAPYLSISTTAFK